MKLNLGCGKHHRQGWVNVDYFGPCDVIVNLDEYPWPFKDESAEEVSMNHVLEHLADPVRALHEIHRILVPGGRADIRVPHYRGPAAHSLGHRTYWSETSLDTVTAEESPRNDGGPFFRRLRREIAYFWRVTKYFSYWTFNKHLPIYPWHRLPLCRPYEIRSVLEKPSEDSYARSDS